MKLAGLMLAGAIALGGCLTAYPHAQPLSKEDVVRLTKEGVSDDIIISQITATHSKYILSVEDILTLKKEKVGERVINHMIRTTRHPGDPPY